MAWGKIHRAWLVLGIAALSLALLLGGAWGLSRSDGFRAWLVDEIKAQVAQATGASLELRSLGGSLLFNINVDGLSLTQEGRKVLEIERLKISYNPLALLVGRIKIHSLVAVRPRVSLPLALPSGGGDGPDLTLILRHLSITGGYLEAGGGLGPLRQASQVEMEGRLTLDERGFKAKLKLHRSLLEMQGLTQPLLLSLEGNLDSKRLRLLRLVASSGPNQVELNGEVEMKPPHRLRAQIKAPRLVAAQLPLAWPLPAQPQGPLALELAAAGSWQRLQLQGSLSQGDQALSLQGWLEPEAGAMALTGRLKRVALAHWGLPQAPVTLNGDYSLASQAWPGGQANPLKLELSLSQATWRELRAGPIKLRAQWQGERVLVESLNLQGPWGRMDARGSLELPRDNKPLTLEAQAGFQELTLPPGLDLPLPAGLGQAKINGQLRAKGPLEDLALELELDKSRAAPGLEIASLKAMGLRRGGHWRLEELHLRAPLANLDVKGRAHLDQADLRFKLLVPDMAELIKRLNEAKLAPPVALAGALEAKGRLRGPWGHPDLKVQLSAGRLFTRNALARQVHLEADVKNLGPRLSGWAQMTAAGWISGEVFLERAAVRAEFVHGKEELLVQAEGPDTGVSFKLTSRDLLKLPFRASLSDLWIRRGALGRWDQRGNAQVLLGGEEVKVKGVEMLQGQERVKLSADIKHSGEIDAILELDSIKLAHVIGPYTNPPPQARLDGEALVGGTLGQPSLKIKGRVRGMEWAGMEPTVVEFSGGYGGERIEIAGQVLYGSRRVMDLKGWAGLSVSLRPPVWEPTAEGIHLEATARELPLALAGSLAPGIKKAEGVASLELKAGGTLKNPTLQGRLKLKDGKLVVGATGQRVEQIELELELDGTRLAVKRARAVSGGKLDVSGEVTLPFRGPGRLNLNLTSQDLLLVAGPYAQMDLTAKARLEGDFEHPVISGRVGVSDIVVRMGLAAPAGLEDVVLLKPGQKPPPLEPKDERFHLPPVLAPLKVDLEVSLGQTTHVTLDDGWMNATGGITLNKESGKPIIFNGVVRVRRGLVLLSGRRFEVLKGKLDFAGKDQPNPDLSAQARLQMGSTTVFVDVAGTANNPMINLSSLPPMNQADILSTIIFGRPSAELNTGQSKELSAQALALMGQAGQKEMSRLFGPDLSPDVVTVHNAPSAGPSLEAGKYLSEDLYLRYRQNLGPYGGQNVGLEYRFTRSLAIESTIGNTRDNGLDFVFTRDFDFFRQEKAKRKAQPAVEKDKPAEKTPGQ